MLPSSTKAFIKLKDNVFLLVHQVSGSTLLTMADCNVGIIDKTESSLHMIDTAQGTGICLLIVVCIIYSLGQARQ